MDSLLDVLGRFGCLLQARLFPALREELGELTEAHKRFVAALGLLQLEALVLARGRRGRPAHDRAMILRAFLAKALFNIPTTRALLDRLRCDPVLRRLCGWESVSAVPDETVFSRAFAEFAESELLQRAHAEVITRTQATRVIGHISRDATAIEVREKPAPKPPYDPKAPRPRRRKGRNNKPEQMTRVERQRLTGMTLEQMVADLPRGCDVGCKTNSSGHKQVWIGLKLHIDAADGQIPVSCLLTSASLHDSQVAVPLACMTAQRVTSLYDLMDSGYDNELIRQHSISLGHVPIIDRQKRGSEKPPMAPHEAARFRERTTVERVYSRLKDEFGCNFVRVRGCAKVMTHVMFGVLGLTADQILRLAPQPVT
jgi:hypothetical protein